MLKDFSERLNGIDFLSGNGTGRVNVDFWGANTWQEGNISGHRWMVLNGQLEDNNDLIEDRRKYLENLIDDILCHESSFEEEEK